jgi:16S rRNA (guanine527-N7)-methyltransferase
VSRPARAPARTSRPARSDYRTTAAPATIERTLDRQVWDSLRPPLSAAGTDVESALGLLRRYAALMLEWNRGVSNIVSKNDEARIVERHLLECVAPARWLIESGARRWIDLGSGAGLPALPLAIAGVGAAWTLVESRRMKTLFVRKTLQDIAVGDFEVVNDRLENVAEDAGRKGAFDGFTSRATMRIGPTLALASWFVRAGGSAFLWKGSGWEHEIEQESAWRADWDLDGTAKVGTGLNIVARFIRRQAD